MASRYLSESSLTHPLAQESSDPAGAAKELQFAAAAARGTNPTGYDLPFGASGTNPAAPEFTPATSPDTPAANPGDAPAPLGVRSPAEFLESYKKVSKAGFNLGPKPVPRRVAFKNLPEWVTVIDILCLVHGGAVDRIFGNDDGDIIVQFCDQNCCQQYLDAYPSGIRLDDDHVIEVSRGSGTEKITSSLASMIEEGSSRLVRISNVPGEKSLQDLHDLVNGMDVDHILYNARAGYVSTPINLLSYHPVILSSKRNVTNTLPAWKCIHFLLQSLARSQVLQ